MSDEDEMRVCETLGHHTNLVLPWHWWLTNNLRFLSDIFLISTWPLSMLDILNSLGDYLIKN